MTSHRWNQDKHETTDPELYYDMHTFGNRLGWDVDISRYGIIDLYANYIRVYATTSDEPNTDTSGNHPTVY